MSAPIPVRPGQIWADADRRSVGRHVRITGISCQFAFVEPVTRSGQRLRGRTTRIQFGDRGLRGYRLVSEPDDTAGSAT